MTGGTDSRFCVETGIPTVVFGPARIEDTHFLDEALHWPDVVTASEVMGDTVRRMLAG